VYGEIGLNFRKGVFCWHRKNDLIAWLGKLEEAVYIDNQSSSDVTSLDKTPFDFPSCSANLLHRMTTEKWFSFHP
jgi:hypothetical protein